jgi:predicted aspartyl protease
LHNAWPAALLVLVSSAAMAGATASNLVSAISTMNTTALASFARRGAAANEARLARGVLAELSGQDGQGILDLRAAVESGQLSQDLRFAGLLELGGLYLRNQRFGEAVAAFEAADALDSPRTDDGVRSLRRGLANARTLAGLAPMTSAVTSAAVVPLQRDSMDFARAWIEIDGQAQQAIVDTGAANSVVSASTAQRLGLRLLDGEGGVTSAGIGDLAARFAMANVVRFAGMEFHNVPFIVLTDAALRFPDDEGPKQLDAIVGLSVLRRLGRIEVHATHTGEQLRSTPPGRRRARDSNLLLAGTLPIVLVRVKGASRALRMALDTGANRTALAPDTLNAFPALAADSTTGKSGMAGAGGVVLDDAARIIRHVDLQVGRRTVGLSKVAVAPGPGNCDGTLGQDVLRSGSGYVIDFGAMRVELLP